MNPLWQMWILGLLAGIALTAPWVYNVGRRNGASAARTEPIDIAKPINSRVIHKFAQDLVDSFALSPTDVPIWRITHNLDSIDICVDVWEMDDSAHGAILPVFPTPSTFIIDRNTVEIWYRPRGRARVTVVA